MRLALGLALTVLILASIWGAPFVWSYMVRRGSDRRWRAQTQAYNRADQFPDAGDPHLTRCARIPLAEDVRSALNHGDGFAPVHGKEV